MTRQWALAGSAALLVALYVVVQVLPLWGTDPASGAIRSAQNDYKHIYLGALLVADGQSPYDRELMLETARLFSREDPRFRTILPFVYPPFTAIVMRPFTWLSFGGSVHAWMLLNHVLTVGGVLLAMRVAGWKWGWPSLALAAGALLLNFTLYRQTNAGQLNGVLLAGYAVVYWLWRERDAPIAAGVLAAGLALFKLSPGILLLWFLLTRRWRAAGAMVAAGVVLLGLSIGVAGWGPHREFLAMLPDMGYGKSTWSQDGHTFWRDPFNQSPNAFLHQLLVPDREAPGAAEAARLANGLTIAASLALLALLAAATWRASTPCGGADGRRDDDASYALAILVSLLVPSLCWDHYLIQALVPASILLRHPGGRGAVALHAAVIVALVAWNLPHSAPAGWIAWWFAPEARVQLPVNAWTSSLKLWPTLLLALATAFMLLAGGKPDKSTPPAGSP